ncbi:MAG: leucine-rich repeat domain-containing protein, partial [Leptospiraceae bacterium]|nr:leucine-rich repeat domain-containing protein [Leptospiraceae bacterium]
MNEAMLRHKPSGGLPFHWTLIWLSVLILSAPYSLRSMPGPEETMQNGSSGTGPARERTTDSYIRTDLNALTGNESIPSLPFDLILPEGYVSVDQPEIPGLLLMHADDVKRVNENGGEIDAGYLRYPLYRIDTIPYVYYDYRKKKFNLEEDRKSKYPMKRMDRSGRPILLVEFHNETRKEDWLLVKMGPRSPVLLILHMQPARDRGLIWQPGRRHWNRFLDHVSGANIQARQAKLPVVRFQPIIADDELYAGDKYYDRQAEPMELPATLPVRGQTTEKQLYRSHPETSLIRRLTFKETQKLHLEKDIEYDLFLSYNIKGDVRGKVNPRMYGYETYESFQYDLYLKDGVVQTFVLVQRIRKDGETVEGPKSDIPAGYPMQRGASPMSEMVTRYSLARSPSFRRNVAHRLLLLDDYLIGSPHNVETTERISAEFETEIPDEIVRFKNLKELSLGPLKHISCRILELKDLTSLGFSGAHLQELPECLGNLKISVLSLSEFGGNEFPGPILNMALLERISLFDGNIRHLPENGPQWQNLEEFHMTGHEISKVPDGFLNAPRLRLLDLSHNRITHLSLSP